MVIVTIVAATGILVGALVGAIRFASDIRSGHLVDKEE